MAKLEMLLVSFPIIAVIAGSNIASDLQAQEQDVAIKSSNRPTIILSNGDAAIIRIGPEHAKPGEEVYPRRTTIGNVGVMVEFSRVPVVQITQTRTDPPRVDDLIGNPARQAALDLSAKPGDFVTPPAANR